MRILLDTCTFLWIITNASELTNHARELFSEPSNEVFLSAVSTWEIAVKYALGRLPLPQSPERFIPYQREKHKIAPLPIKEESTLYMSRLPQYHKDPFDRMLVCQAIVHGFTILTPDQGICQYPVRTIW